MTILFFKAEPGNDPNKIQINLDMIILLEKLVYPRCQDAKWPYHRYAALVLVNGEMLVIFLRNSRFSISRVKKCLPLSSGFYNSIVQWSASRKFDRAGIIQP